MPRAQDNTVAARRHTRIRVQQRPAPSLIARALTAFTNTLQSLNPLGHSAAEVDVFSTPPAALDSISTIAVASSGNSTVAILLFPPQNEALVNAFGTAPMQYAQPPQPVSPQLQRRARQVDANIRVRPLTQDGQVHAPAAARRRGGTLRREGAFHERDRPYWSAGSGHEPPIVGGCAPDTLPENQVWEAEWGPVPRFADVFTLNGAEPSPAQVLQHLNGRFGFNRRAYNVALNILYPPTSGSTTNDTSRPFFARFDNFSGYRQQYPDWAGGITNPDLLPEPSRADDAADPDAPDASSDIDAALGTEDEARDAFSRLMYTAFETPVVIAAPPQPVLLSSSSSSSAAAGVSAISPSSSSVTLPSAPATPPPNVTIVSVSGSRKRARQGPEEDEEDWGYGSDSSVMTSVSRRGSRRRLNGADNSPSTSTSAGAGSSARNQRRHSRHARRSTRRVPPSTSAAASTSASASTATLTLVSPAVRASNGDDDASDCESISSTVSEVAGPTASIADFGASLYGFWGSPLRSQSSCSRRSRST